MDELLPDIGASAVDALEPTRMDARSAIEELTGQVSANQNQQSELTESIIKQGQAEPLTGQSALQQLLPAAILVAAGAALGGGKQGVAAGLQGAGAGAEFQTKLRNRDEDLEREGMKLKLNSLLKRESALLIDLRDEKNALRRAEIEGELTDIRAMQSLAAQEQRQAFQAGQQAQSQTFQAEQGQKEREFRREVEKTKAENRVKEEAEKRRQLVETYAETIAQARGGVMVRDEDRQKASLALMQKELSTGQQGYRIGEDQAKFFAAMLTGRKGPQDEGFERELAQGLAGAPTSLVLSSSKYLQNQKWQSLSEQRMAMKQKFAQDKKTSAFKQAQRFTDFGIYLTKGADPTPDDVKKVRQGLLAYETAKGDLNDLRDTINRSGAFEFQVGTAEGTVDATLLSGLRASVQQALAAQRTLTTEGKAGISPASLEALDKLLPELQTLKSAFTFDAAKISLLDKLLAKSRVQFENLLTSTHYTKDPKQAKTFEDLKKELLVFDSATSAAESIDYLMDGVDDYLEAVGLNPAEAVKARSMGKRLEAMEFAGEDE